MPGSKCVRYEDVEDFLADLPPSTNRYTYEGKKRFDEIANIEYHRLQRSLSQSEPLDDSDISEYFVLIIDPTSFQRDFTVKLDVGVQHSELSRVFHDAVMEALRPMGLNKAIHGYGGTSINVGGGKTKQPDWGWGPMRRPRGVANQPSVVVEWILPGGEANMAITIKVNRRKPMVIIQTWEWDSNSQRPRVTQSCVIEKTGDNIAVSQHPLTIPFNLLFRRPPSIPRETDIELQKQDLVDVGTAVWEMQEL
ncbi:hypothetical protein N7491_008651 [Penicillium cf. griseofulvum]|nr:hypothetical protein N7491_008651 [Penicillium cf. griseofulvum]